MARAQILSALCLLLVFQFDCKPIEVIPYVGKVPNARLVFTPINPLEKPAETCFDKDMKEFKTWSKVCWFDSDGDGRTNGQELGDLECTYNGTDYGVPQDIPLTNPGVCDSAWGEDVSLPCLTFDNVRCVTLEDLERENRKSTNV